MSNTTTDSARKIVDDAGTAVRGAAARATDLAQAQVDKARKTASAAVGDVGAAASKAVHSAGSMVSDRAEQAVGAARSFADDAVEMVREHPVRTALIVVGAVVVVGLVASALMSRR